jgi:hypothetical protein
MPRASMRKLLLSGALGTAVALSLPMTAHASVRVSADSGRISAVAASRNSAMTPDLPQGQWVFTGLTYPDTSTGLDECGAKGWLLEEGSDGEDVALSCRLGNPDAGVYNLWLYQLSGPQ